MRNLLHPVNPLMRLQSQNDPEAAFTVGTFLVEVHRDELVCWESSNWKCDLRNVHGFSGPPFWNQKDPASRCLDKQHGNDVES